MARECEEERGTEAARKNPLSNGTRINRVQTVMMLVSMRYCRQVGFQALVTMRASEWSTNTLYRRDTLAVARPCIEDTK